MNDPIRILIVDDHEIAREGLRTLLEEERDIELVGEAASGREALNLTARLSPEVILLDMVMPNMDGIETIRQLRAAGSTAAIIVLSTFAENHMVRDAVEAGALGYLLKDVSRSELLRAIEGAKNGRPALHPEAQRHLMQRLSMPAKKPSRLEELTLRERDVLIEIAQGRSNKQIATSLNLSEGTVKGYVSIILAKLEVDDRTQAALYAVKEGLVTP